MPIMFEKLLAFPLCARLLVAVNVGILSFALIMQHVFDIRPCVLCQWQRLPYLLAGIVSAIALAAKLGRKGTILMLCLCSLLYLSEFGVALFHSGVERHLWEGTTSCAVIPLKAQSPEELRRALLQTETARCDEVPWTLFGLSMANYNIVLSLLLALFSAAVAARRMESNPS